MAFTRTYPIPIAPGVPAPAPWTQNYLEFAEQTQTSQVGEDQASVQVDIKTTWDSRVNAAIGITGWQFRDKIAGGVPFLHRVTPMVNPTWLGQTLYARSILSCSGEGPLGTRDANGQAQFQFARIRVLFQSYRAAIKEDAAVMARIPASFTAYIRGLAGLVSAPTGGSFLLTITTNSGATVGSRQFAYNVTGTLIQQYFNGIGIPCAVSGPPGGPWAFYFPVAAGIVTITTDGAALVGLASPYTVPVTTISNGSGMAPTEANWQRYVVKKYRTASQIFHTETGSWYFLDGPSAGHTVSQTVPLRQSRMHMAFTVLRMPYNLINWRAIGSCMNCCNLTSFDTDTGGMNLDPGTVLMNEPTIPDPRPLSDGVLGGDVTFNWTYNPQTWNAFCDRADGNRWHTIGGKPGSTADGVKPFPLVDFAQVLSLPF